MTAIKAWEDAVNLVKQYFVARAIVAAGAIVLSSLLTLNAALAQDKTYTMKITLPTLNDPSHVFAKAYAAAIEKDSGGRIKTEIYPASQLGSIPRQIEGLQFGAIQCGLIPPEFFVGVDERFEVMAAPGLVNSMAQGQKLAADPAVLKMMLGLGGDKGLHGVAIFMERSSIGHRKIGSPSSNGPQGQEDPCPRPRRSRPRRSNGSVRRRSQ